MTSKHQLCKRVFAFVDYFEMFYSDIRDCSLFPCFAPESNI